MGNCFSFAKGNKRQSFASRARQSPAQATASAKEDSVAQPAPASAAYSNLNLPDLHPLEGATAEGGLTLMKNSGDSPRACQAVGSSGR